MNRYFTKVIWMASNHVKRCLVSLATMEMFDIISHKLKPEQDTIIYALEHFKFFF